VTQGQSATCYIVAAVASVAGKFPNMVRDVFVNNQNDQGIYAVRLYIRGKPWLITIDDTVLFRDVYNPNPFFGGVNPADMSMFSALIEKAWAKMKGNYLNANNGYTQSGLRALTNAPVFTYFTKD
jgi:hypothetical protein